MKLELNNKNIDNLALNLLTDIDFKYLKEIDLSSNLISDISPIKKLRNLKKIDLSNNMIVNINSLKEISEKNNELESLNLSGNLIDNADILKKNIFPKMQEIKLDKNNLMQKDIDEIKDIIMNNRKVNCHKKNIEINEEEDLAEFENFFRFKKMRKKVYDNLRYYQNEEQNMDKKYIIADKDYEKQNMDIKYIIAHKDYKEDNPLLRPISEIKFFGL